MAIDTMVSQQKGGQQPSPGVTSFKVFRREREQFSVSVIRLNLPFKVRNSTPTWA
jgi:hypothetical protein